jgi:hypothetical protein
VPAQSTTTISAGAEVMTLGGTKSRVGQGVGQVAAAVGLAELVAQGLQRPRRRGRDPGSGVVEQGKSGGDLGGGVALEGQVMPASARTGCGPRTGREGMEPAEQLPEPAKRRRTGAGMAAGYQLGHHDALPLEDRHRFGVSQALGWEVDLLQGAEDLGVAPDRLDGPGRREHPGDPARPLSPVDPPDADVELPQARHLDAVMALEVAAQSVSAGAVVGALHEQAQPAGRRRRTGPLGLGPVGCGHDQAGALGALGDLSGPPSRGRKQRGSHLGADGVARRLTEPVDGGLEASGVAGSALDLDAVEKETARRLPTVASERNSPRRAWSTAGVR